MGSDVQGLVVCGVMGMVAEISVSGIVRVMLDTCI